jgi:1-pyrroline-5-carboxylate dehydrogenase
MYQSYKPEPLTQFDDKEQQVTFNQALEDVGKALNQEYSLVINGDRVKTEQTTLSLNPSNKEQVIGRIAKANQSHAEQAMQAALQAFDSWREVPGPARARYLFKAAAIMRRKKHHFSAWMVYEAGKSWAEADADTAEAIDFMEYYGREMIRLSQSQELTYINGEDNQLSYIPLGVGVIIPPWNFPLAITVGMTTAAIVCGNPVVLKPASTTPVIAYQFLQILEEAGLPKGVVNYIPGSGGEIGDYLVQHPMTRFISFTGSKEVGLRINELAAKAGPKQKWIKRVVAEMGGKNAIIVDQDCDIESAATSIVHSAFGFSGQKCSACSRVFAHEHIYDQLLTLVVQKTKELQVGDVRSIDNYTGPVIDQEAQESIMSYIEAGKTEGKLMLGGRKGAVQGFFIEPTIFADVSPDARIMQEEIFGPVVAFSRYSHFDQALDMANGTEYGLTGAVFTRNRDNLEKAHSQFCVGNLYFNRKSTGAIVGVHPFGGFNMSGTNGKAGGKDYLLLFLQGKLISEQL